MPGAALRGRSRIHRPLRPSRFEAPANMQIPVVSEAFLSLSRRFPARSPARRSLERAALRGLALCSGVAVFGTVGILASLVFEAGRFFV